MNFIKLVTTTVLFSVCFSYAGNELFHSDGTPVEALQDLFDVLSLDCKYDMKSMNEIANERLLRPQGITRSAYRYDDRFEHYRCRVMPILKSLGMIDAVMPQKQQEVYDYVLVHGGTVDWMHSRISFLDELHRFQQIAAKKVIFVVGERKLAMVEKQEMNAAFQPLIGDYVPENESQVARILWHSMYLDSSIRLLPIEFVTTPSEKPATYDSVVTWVAQLSLDERSNLGTKKILGISNNPYVHYQDVATRWALETVLDKRQVPQVETVGPCAKKDESVGIMLDVLARRIYVECQ